MLTFFLKRRQDILSVGAGATPKKGMAVGLTIIEVLATTVVLAFGLSAILSLHVATISSSARSNDFSMASFLAESQSEWLRAMAPEKVASVSEEPEKLTYSGSPCTNPSVEPCYFTRTTKVTSGFPTTSSYAVSINVAWQNGREINFDTVVSKTGF